MGENLYCIGCNILCAMIETGSKLRNGMVVLCGSCEIKRKASDLAKKNKCSNYSLSDLEDLFGFIKK